jgi:hypothetical protein
MLWKTGLACSFCGKSAAEVMLDYVRAKSLCVRWWPFAAPAH